MELNRIYNMECIEGMKQIPDGSIDLICTDPPYNIGKAEWDKIDNYTEWCASWIKECERCLKSNGTFCFFHNDMPTIATLMEWIKHNTGFVFNSFITLDKNHRTFCWKNPSDKNTLRSWFNTCEYCIVYTFQDDRGYSDLTMFASIREYFAKEREKVAHLTYKEINQLLGFKYSGGGHASDMLNSYKLNWKFPLKETYEKFQSLGICMREYDSLREEYDSLREEYDSLRYTHNLDNDHKNVWEWSEYNNGKLHPTVKPLGIVERLIKTSCNPGDTVLDLFMGSGTTAVAAIRTGRNFIGFEISAEYCEIANRRIEEARNETKQLTITEV